MTYKEALIAAMRSLAEDPKVCFIGYGVRHGGQAGGTLRGIHPDQLIETTVAENLMVGMAIGLALAGRRPVVYLERFDFVLNAMDAIVNHLDKAEEISGFEFSPAVILRVVVGNRRKPLLTGATHTQDFTAALRSMVSFPVAELDTADVVVPAYANAHWQLKMKINRWSTALVEYKDLI